MAGDDESADDDGPLPDVVVERYTGKNIERATTKFQQDAVLLADSGYVPTSQSWAPGQWGCGSFLVALLLCAIIVGVLVFIYMLIVKPDGTLTVTYELRSPGHPRSGDRKRANAKTSRRQAPRTDPDDGWTD